jgi:hypothetical protein
VEQVWFSDEISIHFWNSVLVGHQVYASIGGEDSLFSAIELATGEIRWRVNGYSRINSIYTGDRLIFLDQNGRLGMARISPEGFELMAETRITDGSTWTVPTLVGTRLYVRDESRIMAFDLGELDQAG